MDEKDLVKIGAESVFKPVAELIVRLFGPASDEIGEGLRVGARTLMRKLRLFERTQEIIVEIGIEPVQVPLKILKPIIENGSLEDNDGLQDLWARLLANAADPSRGSSIPPAFPEILRQLSALDAMFLEHLYARVCEEEDDNLKNLRRLPFRRAPHTVDLGYRLALVEFFRTMIGERGTPNPHFDEFGITMGNLKRLGLIEDRTDFRSMKTYEDRETEVPAEQYFFTPLGIAFIEACLTVGKRVVEVPDKVRDDLRIIQFVIITENVSNKLLSHLGKLKAFFIKHNDRMAAPEANAQFFAEWLTHPFIGQELLDPSFTAKRIKKLKDDVKKLTVVQLF
jgi:hypothetical protein